MFEYNLGLLTDLQKKELLHALRQKCIPELADWVSAFLAVELIAEISPDKTSLRLFCD